MRAVRRLLARDQQCVAALVGPELARTRASIRLGLLWRAYIGLLQDLCQSYRLTLPAAQDAAADDRYLQALQTFNPDLADVQLILTSRHNTGHWLYQLRRHWQHYWQPDSVLQTNLGAVASDLIATGGSSTDVHQSEWLDDVHAGLLDWANHFEQHHQTN